MRECECCRSYRSLIWAMAIAILCVFTNCQSTTRRGKVFISSEGGKHLLYRNGKPFTIKGAAGFTYLRQLHDAGGNTIRIWDTLHLGQVLDEAYANNIAVIAGLPMPISDIISYYNNRSATAAQYSAFEAIVNKYRSHPALLMWCLGNEVDFPYKPRYKNFYVTYNRLLKMIHTADPDHPVTTALVNFDRRNIYNIRFKVPDLDLISINSFGSLFSLKRELNQFSWFWNGPFLITEWGAKGPWESFVTAWGAPIENTSTKKAEQYLQLYEQSMPQKDPRFLGACVFYWGQKQEVTHTWFNLFDSSGAASETVNVMQYVWTGKWPAHKAPVLQYMLLEGKGAGDNIMLNPGEVYHAEVLFQQPPADSLRVHWELLEEDWFVKNWYEANPDKPRGYDHLFISSGTDKASFRAPAKEGPYRLFATFYDTKGYFATTNTPFYVVEQ